MGKFDEIFDDVVVNAKACASAVSQKASTVYDVSKHKITAAEIRGDINKKLRELGALTYKSEVHGTDNSQQIKLIVSEISDLKDNLDVVNEHIAVAKDQRRCPGCNAVIPKNSVRIDHILRDGHKQLHVLHNMGSNLILRIKKILNSKNRIY